MRKLKTILVFAGLLAFVSCTRCSDCEMNGNNQRVCEQDFDDPSDYDAAVSNLEADGYQCVASI